jgi:hypothetical protein
MISVSSLLAGVSASAITAHLTPPVGSGTILTSFFRLYGISESAYQDNTIRVSQQVTHAVRGEFDTNIVRCSQYYTYAVLVT